MADFGRPRGPEQVGVRPAIILKEEQIIQDYVTVILIPLTTNVKRSTMPSTVLLNAGEGGLPKDSIVLCHQVQVLGKARLSARIGMLEPRRLQEIEDMLLFALGI